MKVIVATDSNEINDFFITKFFAAGYTPIKALGEEEVIATLKETEVDMLVLDYDSDKYNKLETIKKVKLSHNNIINILLTYKSDFQFVKQANELGVFAIIPKLEDNARQFNEIMESLKNLKNRKEEKRKFIRVKPNPDEKAFSRIKIPGIQTLYSGKIKDISLGGALIELSDNISETILYPNKTIVVAIEIDTLVIKAECIVVLKRGLDLAIRFVKLNELNITNLSKYILTRLK